MWLVLALCLTTVGLVSLPIADLLGTAVARAEYPPALAVLVLVTGVFAGVMLGMAVLSARIAVHPWELAISPDGLRLREAGRTWVVRWDEVRQVAVRPIYGQRAILLWMIVETRFPRVSLVLQRPGPGWVPSRKAVAFAFPLYYQGGLQAISSALRRHAGPRWSET